ncbi:hypothetical protein Mapa_008976 [Marchantia paleacea]|nr:hypothetical protein Mapa_008976 [Marchantia paleacea]
MANAPPVSPPARERERERENERRRGESSPRQRAHSRSSKEFGFDNVHVCVLPPISLCIRAIRTTGGARKQARRALLARHDGAGDAVLPAKERRGVETR